MEGGSWPYIFARGSSKKRQKGITAILGKMFIRNVDGGLVRKKNFWIGKKKIFLLAELRQF